MLSTLLREGGFWPGALGRSRHGHWLMPGVQLLLLMVLVVAISVIVGIALSRRVLHVSLWYGLVLVPLVKLPGVQAGAIPSGGAALEVRYIVILSGGGITAGLVITSHPRHVLFARYSRKRLWITNRTSKGDEC